MAVGRFVFHRPPPLPPLSAILLAAFSALFYASEWLAQPLVQLLLDCSAIMLVPDAEANIRALIKYAFNFMPIIRIRIF